MIPSDRWPLIHSHEDESVDIIQSGHSCPSATFEPGPCEFPTATSNQLWMDEILHHFEAMGNHLFVGIDRGIESF